MFRNSDKETRSASLLSTTRKLIASVVCVLLTFSTLVVCHPSQASSRPEAADREINMLVVGDSVMWGEGLKTEHKSWYQVKTWLAKTTNRVVVERIEAHTGAIIEGADVAENLSSADGEVNVAVPTINEQVNRALRFYGEGSKVDLVLVNGCANDIGARNLLNAAISTDEIRGLTEAKCGPPVEKLLRRITSSFPNARVIVTGYYPFFSEKTRNNIFLKAMARRFFKDEPGARRMSSKVTLQRLIANSKTWYETSNLTLAAAVARANGELSHPRIAFTEIHLLPEHSFGAGESHLWSFDHSPFKRLRALLSFGKMKLGTNDECRKQRNASCDEYYKRQAKDSSEQQKDREIDRLTCRYAALGHPNRKGAALYAEAITSQLKSTINQSTWLSESGVRAKP
jgi:lysophospholipase L1-like esterase